MLSLFLSGMRKVPTILCAGVALSLVFTVSQARADYTFHLGDLLVDDDADSGNILLSDILPAGTYTSYSLSVDWSAVSGNPYSEEGIWALTDNATVTNSNIFYADPGSSNDAVSSSDPVTLNWSDNFDTPYSSGPLYFLTLQTFGGSVANWGNTTLILKNDPIISPPPPSTGFTMPTVASGSVSLGGTLAAGEVVWYDFLYTGGGMTIDTLGSDLTDAGFGPNDTEIGLYNALGGLVANNDDADLDVRTSELTFENGELITGDRYYIAIGAFNTTFNSKFGVTSSSEAAGTYRLNVTLAPELNSGALIGVGAILAGGIGIIRRKRTK